MLPLISIRFYAKAVTWLIIFSGGGGICGQFRSVLNIIIYFSNKQTTRQTSTCRVNFPSFSCIFIKRKWETDRATVKTGTQGLKLPNGIRPNARTCSVDYVSQSWQTERKGRTKRVLFYATSDPEDIEGWSRGLLASHRPVTDFEIRIWK
jgi:hypothetical protein